MKKRLSYRIIEYFSTNNKIKIIKKNNPYFVGPGLRPFKANKPGINLIFIHLLSFENCL